MGGFTLDVRGYFHSLRSENKYTYLLKTHKQKSSLVIHARLVHTLHFLLSQEGAVVALFKICRQDRFKDLYAHALRTVASICCVEEGINQLDKVDRSPSLSLRTSSSPSNSLLMVGMKVKPSAAPLMLPSFSLTEYVAGTEPSDSQINYT